MKRTLTSIAAASLVLGTMAPVAMAATTTSYSFSQRHVTVDGTNLANPWGFVSGGTNYFPIYYLQKALGSMAPGAIATWDGKDLMINIPNFDASKLMGPTVPGANGIYINGTLVQKFTRIVTNDKGTKIQTSFAPIFSLFGVLEQLGLKSSWSGDGTWSLAPSLAKLTIAGNSTIGVGGSDTLSLTGTDSAGNAVTIDQSKVTWSTTGGVISSTGVFAGTASGSATVTATYMGMSTTATVAVYGQVSSVTLSAATPKIIANGNATDVITVNAVDANGNVVQNFNGSATVAYTATGSNGAVTLPAPATVTFTNGVGTFSVTASNTVGLTDTLTVNSLTSTTSTVSPSVGYGSVAVTTAAPGASQLGLSASMPALTANTQSWATLTVKVEDASGAQYNGATEPVTLTLTGPGSFSSTSMVTTETIYVVGSNAGVTVYSQTGQAGSIQITASSAGLTPGTLSLDSFVNSAPASLKVTSAPMTASDGTPFTLYTVQLVDANGHLVTQNNGVVANDAISFTDNTANTGGTLVYKGYNTSTLQPTAVAPTALLNGVAYFAVENTTVGSSADTITVKDATQNFTATAPYSYVTGSAATVAVSPSSSSSNTIQAGSSVTVSAQLTDSNGNNVSTAGQVVTFSFVSNTGVANSLFANNSTTFQATTNASGVATATITVPSTATGTFHYQAQLQGAATAVSGATYGVTGAVSYVTSLALDATTPLPPNNQLAAGTPAPGITVDAKNAIGSVIISSDKVTVTTSNPNVIQLAGGVYDNGSTNTVTISQTANYVLPAIKGMLAGTATVTVTDVSNPQQPSYSFTLTVNPSTSSVRVIELNGSQISSTNGLTVTANTPVAVQVVNVDGGGNPVPVAADTLVSLNDINGGQFEGVSGGPKINDVLIASGQTTATVYYVNAIANTYTNFAGVTGSGAVTAVTATAASATPVAGVANTITLTAYDVSGQVDSAINGTVAVTVSGYTAVGVTNYGSFNGTALTAGPNTINVTFTNGIATVPLVLDSATAQTVVFFFEGQPATGVAITPTAAALSAVTAITYTSTTLGTSGAGTLAAPTLTGTDAYGNAVTPASGTFTVAQTTGTGGGVTIVSTTGALTATSAHAGDTFTVTYTQGAVTKTQLITIG